MLSGYSSDNDYSNDYYACYEDFDDDRVVNRSHNTTNKPKSYRIPLGKQLNSAIENGDVTTVAKLLEKKVGIRQRDLNTAVLKKHTKILRMLLDDGHYYDKSEIALDPLLRTATTDGSDEIVDVLLQHGANPNTRNRQNVTVLTIALKQSNFRVANLLYRKGAQIKDCPVQGVIHWIYYQIEHEKDQYDNITKELIKDPRLDLNRSRSDNVSFLGFALQKNNIAIIRVLLEQGARLGKSTLEEKQRLLSICATYGYDNSLLTLLNNTEVDINGVDEHKRTPLELALSHKQQSTVNHLLLRKASVTEAHIKIAIQAENMDTLKLLLRHTTIPAISMDLFCDALESSTAPAIIQCLLIQGLVKDLNASDSKGRTPLSVTLKQKNVEMTRLLLSKGASLEKNKGINACLGDAVEALDILMTTLLLEYLKDPIDSVQREGVPLLHIALRSSRPDKFSFHHYPNNSKKQMVEFLLSKGVDTDSYHTDGDAALHYCIRKGEKDLVEILIKAKANVNKPHLINKKTPLHIAAEKNDHESTRQLLEANAFPDATDLEGNTPLICALNTPLICAFLAYTTTMDKVADLLIAHHANVNIGNLKGQTPLSIALANNRYDLLIKLLRCGADSISVGGHQKLMLCAVKNKSQGLFLVLKTNKADVNQPLEGHKNALYLALVSGDLVFCEFLLKEGCQLSVGVEERSLRNYLEQAVKNKYYYLVAFCLKKGVILDVDEAILLFSNLIINNQPTALQTLLERGFILTDIIYQERNSSLEAPFCLAKIESKETSSSMSSYYSSSSSYSSFSSEPKKINKPPLIFAAEKKLIEILKLLIRYELRPKWEIRNIVLPEKKQNYYSNDYPHSMYQEKLREKKQIRPTHNPYANQHSYKGYHSITRWSSSILSDHFRTEIHRTEIRSLIDHITENVKKELHQEKTLIRLKYIASLLFQGMRQPATGIPHLPGEIIAHILLYVAIEIDASIQESDICKMVDAAAPIESNTYKRYADAGLFKSCQEIDIRELFDANGTLIHSRMVNFKVGTQIRVCIDGKAQLFELTAEYFSSSSRLSSLRLERTLTELFQLTTKGIYDSRPGVIFNDANELISYRKP